MQVELILRSILSQIDTINSSLICMHYFTAHYTGVIIKISPNSDSHIVYYIWYIRRLASLFRALGLRVAGSIFIKGGWEVTGGRGLNLISLRVHGGCNRRVDASERNREYRGIKLGPGSIPNARPLSIARNRPALSVKLKKKNQEGRKKIQRRNIAC